MFRVKGGVIALGIGRERAMKKRVLEPLSLSSSGLCGSTCRTHSP